MLNNNKPILMKSKYLLYALPTLMLAACSSDEPLAGAGSNDGAAVVTADIAGMTKTRAFDTSWEQGDKIGISGTSGSAVYTNVPYLTDGTGAFTSALGVAQGIFFQDTDIATFSAYYPYNAAVTADNAEITANTSDQSASKGFDFLFASGAKGSVANPAINFTGEAAFSHKMTQLVIKLTADNSAGFDAAAILSDGKSSIAGLKSEGKFNTLTGEATATGTAADWILNDHVTPSTEGSTTSYSMILFPQEATAGLTYSIEYDGATYSCVLTPALEAGKRYTYNITLKKSGLSVASSTITDWIDEESEDIDVDMEYDPFNGHEAVLMREASGTKGSEDYVPALYLATCNIGAEKPESVGQYFWWGDTKGYDTYSGIFNVYDFTIITTLHKYPDKLKELGYLKDDSLTLAYEYDVARVRWNGEWRIPTYEELEWLVNNCTWTPDTQTGCYTVTSNTTNNSIIFRGEGTYPENPSDETSKVEFKYGYYWSSSIDPDKSYNSFRFNVPNVANAAGELKFMSQNRYWGANIRAVVTI